MGVRQDEETAFADRGDLAGIVGTLMGLATAARRFDDDERSLGSQRRVDRRVAHVGNSGISGRSIALLTALQNGRSCGFKLGQTPRLNTLPASSRPPSTDLNQVPA